MNDAADDDDDDDDFMDCPVAGERYGFDVWRMRRPRWNSIPPRFSNQQNIPLPETGLIWK